MSKNIKDICFIIQSRLDSKRLPKKMLTPFAGSNLFEIAIAKLVNCSFIPNENIYLSLYDQELISIGKKYPVNIFKRSKESVSESKEPKVVSEWGWKLPHKWFITINACTPLLTNETIINFTKCFLNSPNKSLFAVHNKKNFYWDEKGNMITKYPGSLDSKLVNNTFEAAHCLYAGCKKDLSNNVYLGDFTFNYPELYEVHEKETFDIDEFWQFKVAEILYKNKNKFL
jgi:CMP-N-acetylneuraminic acid synthetase